MPKNVRPGRISHSRIAQIWSQHRSRFFKADYRLSEDSLDDHGTPPSASRASLRLVWMTLISSVIGPFS
ncbi:hypothetical protein CU048_15275 [Beijerinckiaceae bacterium]|nr:hypothetical protein CU048_15275 [Beijerinckiaceae bacterium]